MAAYPTCTECEDFDCCPLGDDCPVAAVAEGLGL